MTIIAGIDYSMTSPGITIWDSESALCKQNLMIFGLHSTKKYQGIFQNVRIDPYPLYSCDQDRFDKISEWCVSILKSNFVSSLNIEGYSMGSTGKVFHIAENTGVLKHKLRQEGISFKTPAPTQIKKIFTGKGNSGKDLVVARVKELFNIDMISLLDAKNYKTGPVNDLCDSVAILCTHDLALTKFSNLLPSTERKSS